MPQLVRLAEAFRPWGVRLAVSIDFSSPQRIGGLDTFDPLDAGVAAFWRTVVDRIYAQIPDFAGFVLKADSEGRLGPSAYGRTHADAATVIARALAATVWVSRESCGEFGASCSTHLRRRVWSWPRAAIPRRGRQRCGVVPQCG